MKPQPSRAPFDNGSHGYGQLRGTSTSAGKGPHYRFSLSRYVGKEIVSKSDADALADDDHYVQLIRAMSRWAVRKGHRTGLLVHDDSDVLRRRKETQRHRRLEPGEEEKLLAAAEPHLRAVITAALETCCRQGESLSLRWADVSIARGEIVLRAEHTKDREKRVIPISSRLRDVSRCAGTTLTGDPFLR